MDRQQWIDTKYLCSFAGCYTPPVTYRYSKGSFDNRQPVYSTPQRESKAIIILELEVLLLLHGLQEVIVKRLITLVIAHLELIVLGLEVDITALIAQVQKDIFHDKLYKLLRSSAKYRLLQEL